jgi:hypothetical protein
MNTQRSVSSPQAITIGEPSGIIQVGANWHQQRKDNHQIQLLYGQEHGYRGFSLADNA